MATRALENLAAAGFADPKISVVVTRHNVDQLDDFTALAARYGATLRITRLRPPGVVPMWDELHPTAAQQVALYDWLVLNGECVLTGDSSSTSPASASRGTAGTEHVRRRAGGVPDRSGR